MRKIVSYAQELCDHVSSDLPLGVALALEHSTQLFEVRDVSDLLKNYKRLAQEMPLPQEVLTYLRALACDQKLTREAKRELSEYLSLVRDPGAGMHTPCVGTLDHVTLESWEFIIRDSFQACRVDVIDRNGQSVPALFFYEHTPEQGGDLIAQQQLERVLLTPGGTTFGIEFQALPLMYDRKRCGHTILILDIHTPRQDGTCEVLVPSSVYFLSRRSF